MLRFLSYYVLFILAALPCVLTAQECEWLETGKGVGVERSYDVAVDNNNNYFVVADFSATFSIKNFSKTYTFTKSVSGSTFNGLLIKYDKNGEIKWTSQSIISSSSATCSYASVTTDAANSVYVLARYYNTVNFGGSFSLTSNYAPLVNYAIIKYDSSGTIQWVKDIGPISNAGSLGPSSIVVDNQNNIVVGFSFRGDIGFSGTSQQLNTSASNTQQNIGVAKYTNSGAFVKAINYGPVTSTDIYEKMAVDADNNIYVLYDARAISSSISYSDTGIKIVKIDSALNPIDSTKFFNNTNTRAIGIAVTPGGSSVITGFFRDTINFNGIGLKAVSTSALKSNSFIAYLDKNLNPVWVKRDNPTTNGIAQPLGGIDIRNGFVYLGGILQIGSTTFGSIFVPYVSPSFNMYAVKMDTLGNFLWAFSSGVVGGTSTTTSLAADLDGNGIITGRFTSKISVFNIADTSNYTSENFFTAKIVDYSITRGNVNPGPYCAGDSFDIPFTKTGRYDTGNFFIAQLSDSAGNFDGNERELGRIKDTATGTIRGILPLFDVATTEKYRIRIISTKPVVQSFFRRDTLRLLIYSKDTANAGADITICKGQQIRLGTTGGSRWLWSPPNYFLSAKDTSNRQPLIKPDTTAEYRIIISDSSGCGVTDTDYVKVIVRPSLQAVINGINQTCRGQQVLLSANVTGGDSTYWYRWQIKDSTTVLSVGDTITVAPNTTTAYRLIVGDSCTSLNDTALFTLQIDTLLTVTTSPDTIICRGDTALLRAFGNGCDTANYVYQWADSSNTSVVLGTQSTLIAAPSGNTTYRVILADGSSSLTDTAFVKVVVDNVFTVTTTLDSTLCKGQNTVIEAFVTACDTSQITYTWDNSLGTGKVKLISPTQTTTYRVIAVNSFNGLADTAFVTITVRDSLEVFLNPDTTLCVGGTAALRANATGGNSNTYQIRWAADDGSWVGNGFTETVTPTTTTVYKAVLSDACTVNNDSAFITVTLLDSIKASTSFTDTTVCIGETLTLRGNGNGGKPNQYSYSWKQPDNVSVGGQNYTVSSIQTPTYYTLLLTDNCTNYTDSVTVYVNVRQPLTVSASGKTLLCYQENTQLTANATGGDSSKYRFTWIYPDNTTDTAATIVIQPDSSFNLLLVADDNCSTPQRDSIVVPITLPQPISVNIPKNITLCLGQPLLLSAAITGGSGSTYRIRWQGNAVSPSDTTENIALQPSTSGTYQYTINVSDNCARQANDTITVQVLPSPIAAFSIDTTSGCLPLLVTATDLSQNHDSTQNNWRIYNSSFNNTAQSTNATFQLTQSGMYNVFLRVKNSLGCSDSVLLSNAVDVFALPTASFYTSPSEVKLVEEPVSFINSSTGAATFKWFLGEDDSVEQANYNDVQKTFFDTGKFVIRLVATSVNGCKDTATSEITVSDPFTFFIPTAFSPISSRGINDVFAPITSGSRSYSMSIYDRWGEIIYDCNCNNGCNTLCSWDGNYKGVAVPEGVYGYIIRFVSNERRIKTVSGTITLIR